MRLSIIDSSQSGIIIYQEIKSVLTNISGVFSIIIGAKEMNKIVTTGDFYSIEWSKNKFFIKVEIDPDNNLNFILAGTQKLNYVPYAYFAKNVDVSGLKGIVPIGNGGTGTNNLGDFKKQLEIDKVNNTDDNEKPVSKIQQLAIDQKLSIDDTSKMLQSYLRKSDYNARMNDTVYFTTTPDSSLMIELIKKYIDTFNLPSNKTIDTSSLSSRINLKPSITFVKNYADSVSNLAKTDTSSLSSRIDLKPSTSFVKNYADSVSNLAKIDTSSLSSRIDLKPSTSFVKNYADSVSNLAKIDTSSLSSRIDLKPSTSFVKNYADSVSNLAKIDTSSLSSRIDLKPSTSFVKNYADSVSNLAKIDTSALSSRIDLKPSTSFVKNYADSVSNLAKIDTSSLSSRIDLKTSPSFVKNYADSVSNLAKIDTSSLSSRIDLKPSTSFAKNYADSVSNLAKVDTSSLSSRIDLKPSTTFVKDYADSVSNLAKVDTSSLSSRIELKPSTSYVKNYADSVSNLAKIDTSSLSSRIELKPSTSFVKNYADSVSNLVKIDTSSLSSRIDLKPSTSFVKNYADSVSNLAKVDTSSLSTRINTKASIDSLNQRAFITDVDLKEDKVNKSNNILTDSNSVLKYPTVKSIKGYVDSLHGMTIVSDRLAGSIPSTKLIGTDITKVGTITTGTWNGTNIGVDFGGTGTNTLNGILLGNGTGAIGTANYGYFYDTTTQSALLPDKEYAITYNATGFARGITVESNSKIKVSNKGLYNLQFSAQLDRTTGNTTCYITIWLKINGIDLPYSSTDITIQGTTAVSATVAAWNFFLDLNANDYVELMWSTTNTNAIIQFLGSRTNPVRPAIPSIILTMHQVY